jgi:hypothetical protein
MGGGSAQFADGLALLVEAVRGGARVADGWAEGDPAAVDGGAGEDAAVVEEGLADAAVDVVEVWFGRAGRVVAEADDVEGGPPSQAARMNPI